VIGTNFEEILFRSPPSEFVELLVIPLDPSIPGIDCVGSWAGDRIVCVGDYTLRIPGPITVGSSISGSV